MPVRIADDLPARQILEDENIFVMRMSRASAQEIRPLSLVILNLMPTKIVTETQLLRVLGGTALQVDITFLRTASHVSRNTSPEHLDAFYKTFDEIKHRRFDGLIITGAPVEQMAFEDVSYWNELVTIMDWAQDHVFSTLYICWAAQAGLYYRFGVPKYPLQSKCSGIYKHHRYMEKHSKLLRGFDDVFYAPHSRHTEVRVEDILGVDELELLAESWEAGVYIAASKDGKHVFVTGHAEYDADTLQGEYERDRQKGMDVPIPCNYFEDDDPSKTPLVRWRSHANLLFSNWLNYYVYQETPYDWTLPEGTE